MTEWKEEWQLKVVWEGKYMFQDLLKPIYVVRVLERKEGDQIVVWEFKYDL